MRLTAILRHKGGATAIEYGLIVALIAVTLILTVESVGGGLNATLTTVRDTLAAI